MRLADIIRRIWWIFAIDAVAGVFNVLMFSPAVSKLNAAGEAFEIFGYTIVTIAALFAAIYSGKIFTAIKIGAMFWFIWRPILFIMLGALTIATGSVGYKYAMLAALGYVFAQLLVSPIVFILCGCAGWLGSKFKRAEG